MKRAPAKCSARRRCAAPRRPSAEVLEELRDYAVRWRTCVYLSLARPLTVEEARRRESAQVTYAIDEDLTALALELSRKLCRWCAEEQAQEFLQLRRLVFTGLLGTYRTSGRDERAEEEFELAGCPA